MTSRELLYIITIFDEGSFSAASKKLYISQSALSQAIGKLEWRYGAELFIRGTHRTEPTEACRIIVRRGRDILSSFEALEDDLRIYADVHTAELVVGMPPTFIKNLLPSVLPIFESQHPNINVRIIENSSNTLERLAMQGIIDLCVVQLPSHLASIETLPLLTSELLLAVPRSHSFCKLHPYLGLERLERIPVAELREQPLALVSNPRITRLWKPLFRSAGFEPSVYRESSVWSNIIDYVKHGVALGFIDEIVVRHDPDEEDIAYYRIDSELIRQETIAAYQPGKKLSRQAQWFLDAVKAFPLITNT